MERLTPDLLLAAYASGYFPMAESRESQDLRWFYPETRGIIPLDAFHVPEKLAKLIRQRPFEITVNSAFGEVITACAARKDTWINDTIIDLYCQLHEIGFAHSVECWQEETLAGGLYGIAIGGAFFGESMFSRTSGASKVALAYLVNMLTSAGYTLLDTQFVNPHLKQFGTIEIPRDEYLKRLREALAIRPRSCF
jgi:leucyl/phenylalanyl-tRNA---protein transferase